MRPDWLRKRQLLVGGLGAVALALSVAAGFALANYQFMQAVGPEYKSWPELIEAERSLLPVAETMLRTRDALKQREADLTRTLDQREKDLKDRYDRRDAEQKLRDAEQKLEAKRLEDVASKFDPDNRDIAKLQERVSALELELDKERATNKPLLKRVSDLERPSAALGHKLEAALGSLDSSIRALDARLQGTKGER